MSDHRMARSGSLDERPYMVVAALSQRPLHGVDLDVEVGCYTTVGIVLALFAAHRGGGD